MMPATLSILVALVAGCGAPPEPPPRGRGSDSDPQREPKSHQLFTRVDLDKTELAPKQQKILQRIMNRGTHLAFEVVKLDKESLKRPAEPLAIPLPRRSVMSVTSYKLDDADGVQQLKGHGRDKKTSVTLAITGESASGMLYHDKNVYAVEPLGDGLHVIALLDQSKYGPDEPPGPQSEIERPR